MRLAEALAQVLAHPDGVRDHGERRVHRADAPEDARVRDVQVVQPAYISRGKAVLSVGRIRLSGFAGWLAWLFIHIGFLTGFRNRFGALLSWWFAFTRDLRRERTFTNLEVGWLTDMYAAVPKGAPAGHDDRLSGAG